MFFKAFNADLTGYRNYPFAVGEVYEERSHDSWDWFHYTDKLTTALEYYHQTDVRFCEVEPLGKVAKFQSGPSRVYYATNKLRLVREISRHEAFSLLLAEGCPYWQLECLDPPYETLLHYKAKLLGHNCYKVLMRPDLTAEQKKVLLPKTHHPHIPLFRSAPGGQTPPGGDKISGRLCF